MLKEIKVKKRINKRGVSLMVSYVILISIVLGLAVGTYAVLKYITSDIEPEIDCNIGSSLILEEYVCSSNSLKLNLKNNGRFNVNGVLVSISNETQREAIKQLVPSVGVNTGGNYEFTSELGPGEDIEIEYTKSIVGGGSTSVIEKIKLQPYIFDEGGNRVYCRDAVIRQDVSGCNLL
jgi:hypothetical protein